MCRCTANPVDDILAKLTIKVVIDGGTRHQKTSTFSPTDEDAFRTDVRIHDVNPAFPDIPSFFIMPRMKPLNLGHHTYDFIWVLSAPHCDGISADFDVSCLPAGEFPTGVLPVDVSTTTRVAASSSRVCAAIDVNGTGRIVGIRIRLARR